MQLNQVLKSSSGPRVVNRGDDDARALFAARAVALMLEDARQRQPIGSTLRYSSETIVWFNKLAIDRLFRFQPKVRIAEKPEEDFRRPTFFRKAAGDVIGTIVTGFVVRDRGTLEFISKLRDAADQHLADYVLTNMGAYEVYGSEEDVQDFFTQLRHSRSFRALRNQKSFIQFCETAPASSEYERRFQRAGRIAGGLC